MITISKFMSTIFALMTLNSFNPVKLSALILLFSTSVFLLMYLVTGASWFPVIFYMLFMGGILVMFMILSSTMPNEKTMKIKAYILSGYLMASVIMTTTMTSMMEATHIKEVLMSTRLMASLTIIIALYFFYFLSIISSKKVPLRGLYN